jgi:hypothetical protein
MKKTSIALLVSMFLALSFGSALAQISSAKGSAAISDPIVIQATAVADGWQTVSSTMIKVPQAQELSFDVALQCGLYTDTLVKSKGGTKDTSTAEAAIDVRVMVQPINQDGTLGDAFYAYPNQVTYAKRAQTLMAKFQGIFQKCEITDPVTGECIQYGTDTCLDVTPVDSNGDGVIDDYETTLDMDCLDYEEVQLVLNTVNANAFNFVSPNLDQGEYKVTVQAKISSSTDATNGSAEAKGVIGLGSMVVDQVRYIKDDSAGTGM